MRRAIRNTRRLLLIALVVGAVCYVGSVLAVGLALSAPRPAAVGNPPSSLPGARTVSFEAPGAVLRGWWAPGHPGAGVVVLMHGLGANRGEMVRRAAVLHEAGFGCLLFDFRAEGESTGARITFGRNEALDARAAVAFARAAAPGERVGAIGVSLGGAASVLGPEPLPVDALVLESVYPEFDAALGHRLRVALGPVAGRVFPALLIPAFRALMPAVLGFGPSELAVIDRIGTVRAPLLVLSGTVDDYTPLTEAVALYDRAPGPKSFWAVPGAGHVDLERFDPAEYWRRVMPFLRANLRPG